MSRGTPFVGSERGLLLGLQARMWGQRPSALVGLSDEPVVAFALDEALFYRVMRFDLRGQQPQAPAGMHYERLTDLPAVSEPSSFDEERQREIAERWGPH